MTTTSQPGPASSRTSGGGTGPGPGRVTAGQSWRAVGGEAFDLLRLTGRLLARWWYVLIGIAALGLTAAHWGLHLSVLASRSSATLGILVFAIVPAFAFMASIGMLVVMGRLSDRGTRSVTATLSTFASALILYLVLYEQNGQLSEDRRTYLYEATMEAILGGIGDVDSRVPEPISFSILSAILVALVVRSIGAKVLERHEQAEEVGTTRGGRGTALGTGVLRALVTYSELVWLVLSVLVVIQIGRDLGGWWDSRVLVHAASDAWASLGLPEVAPWIGTVSRLLGVLGGFAVAGILVPTAWLALGSILYGRRRGAPAVLAQRAAEVTATIGGRVRLPKAHGHALDLDRLERSWNSLVRPTSRWGPLGGALGLVLARGWMPVLVFCVLFSVLAQADYAVWWIADQVLPTVAASDWRALYPLISTTGAAVVQVLTLALVAAGTELTLRRLGMPSVLRLPERAHGPSRAG